jgi:hypothetical protein
MNLEDQVLSSLSKEIQEAIDFELIAELLKSIGWTKVKLSRYVDNYHAIDIQYWVKDNCQGKTRQNGATWLFEVPKDATMFILRWGS